MKVQRDYIYFIYLKKSFVGYYQAQGPAYKS